MIEQTYLEIGTSVSPEHKWLFHTPLPERLTETYLQQIAWLDGVRRVYPDKYKSVRGTLRSERLEQQELEYVKKQAKWT